MRQADEPTWAAWEETMSAKRLTSTELDSILKNVKQDDSNYKHDDSSY